MILLHSTREVTDYNNRRQPCRMLLRYYKAIPHIETQVYRSTHEVTVSSFCYFLLPSPERNTDVPTGYTSREKIVTPKYHKSIMQIKVLKQQKNHVTGE